MDTDSSQGIHVVNFFCCRHLWRQNVRKRGRCTSRWESMQSKFRIGRSAFGIRCIHASNRFVSASFFGPLYLCLHLKIQNFLILVALTLDIIFLFNLVTAIFTDRVDYNWISHRLPYYLASVLVLLIKISQSLIIFPWQLPMIMLCKLGGSLISLWIAVS
jgi:hypothetical protein